MHDSMIKNERKESKENIDSKESNERHWYCAVHYIMLWLCMSHE